MSPRQDDDGGGPVEGGGGGGGTLGSDERSTSDVGRGVETRNVVVEVVDALKREYGRGRPPAQVEDTSLLLYDVFLLVNLSVSISFWAVQRMDPTYIGSALSEGCLLSLCWIGGGMWTGSFLHSAIDGHYGPSDGRGGPGAAGLLAFHTYVNAVNLRLVAALLMAASQHRPIGDSAGEQLLPLEIGLGFVLMSSWRALHSAITPRL